jgi:hypothetical protein
MKLPNNVTIFGLLFAWAFFDKIISYKTWFVVSAFRFKVV